MSSDWLVMRCINNMAWRSSSRWLHLTTWLQWVIARNGKRWPSWLADFSLWCSLPLMAVCCLCHTRACATTTPQTLILFAFSPVYDRKKVLVTVLDPYYGMTGEVTRWQGLVSFKALICLSMILCCHSQELMRERENHIPKQTDLSFGLSGGAGCVLWNA